MRPNQGEITCLAAEQILLFVTKTVGRMKQEAFSLMTQKLLAKLNSFDH